MSRGAQAQDLYCVINSTILFDFALSGLTLRGQLLQSSITRAGCGQAGTASIGALAAAVAKLPRVKAIESRKGSVAAMSAVRTFVASNRDGMAREPDVVQTDRVGAAVATAVRTIETVRAARLQRMTSRRAALASTNAASLPPAIGR